MGDQPPEMDDPVGLDFNNKIERACQLQKFSCGHHPEK